MWILTASLFLENQEEVQQQLRGRTCARSGGANAPSETAEAHGSESPGSGPLRPQGSTSSLQRISWFVPQEIRVGPDHCFLTQIRPQTPQNACDLY